jgi:small subunit ribosomal protein S11
MDKEQNTPVESVEPQVVSTDAPVVDETADVKKAVSKKKKLKRTVPNGQVHISATFNNTIITVTDSSGGVIAAASAGAVGFRGSKKGTAYAAQVAVDKAITTAKQNNGLSRVDVFIKGIGQGRDSAIRAISAQNMQIESIKDNTSMPHAGCRPRKARRG